MSVLRILDYLLHILQMFHNEPIINCKGLFISDCFSYVCVVFIALIHYTVGQYHARINATFIYRCGLKLNNSDHSCSATLLLRSWVTLYLTWAIAADLLVSFTFYTSCNVVLYLLLLFLFLNIKIV